MENNKPPAGISKVEMRQRIYYVILLMAQYIILTFGAILCMGFVYDSLVLIIGGFIVINAIFNYIFYRKYKKYGFPALKSMLIQFNVMIWLVALPFAIYINIDGMRDNLNNYKHNKEVEKNFNDYFEKYRKEHANDTGKNDEYKDDSEMNYSEDIDTFYQHIADARRRKDSIKKQNATTK